MKNHNLFNLFVRSSEGANRQRGRFEFAFGTIGSGVMVGGAFGGINGLYTGIKATQGMTGNVRRTQ